MKKFIKTFPLHSFLIGPAIIFFLFAHNFYEVEPSSIWRSLFITLFISFTLFGICYILFKKDLIKTAIFTTLALCSFFSYGFIYDFLETLYFDHLWPFSNIHRYLTLFYILSFGFVFLYLRRANRTFNTSTKAFNVFTYTLILFNLIILISKSTATHTGKEEDENTYIPNAHSGINTDSLPDIYYIILDGYANDSILSARYNYPSNTLTTFLQKNEFYIASGSRGNYLVTSESLGSSLNYSYLNPSQVERGKNIIYKNKVCQYLKKKYYYIVHVCSGYSVTKENFYADTIITTQNLNEFERTLLRYTIFRLDDLTGYVHYLTLKEQLASLRKVPKIKSPKFSFIHIVSPHPPYVCNETGQFRTNAKMINTWWEPMEEYLAQLKFINSQIQMFIADILKTSRVKPIILLQSDHGPWVKSGSLTEIYNARSLILNAYYIPYQWKNKVYSTITPVNSFPVIFNGLFKDSIPLQLDTPMDSINMERYTQTKQMMN